MSTYLACHSTWTMHGVCNSLLLWMSTSYCYFMLKSFMRQLIRRNHIIKNNLPCSHLSCLGSSCPSLYMRQLISENCCMKQLIEIVTKNSSLCSHLSPHIFVSLISTSSTTSCSREAHVRRNCH